MGRKSNAAGVYNSGGITLSDGDDADFQLDSTGKLLTSTTITANSSVNISQINGVTPLMGNGASGTGALRISLASDSTGNIATIGTSVTPGTGATNLGKAEDAAHTTGDTGVMSLAVRNDALAAFSNTDLDYTPIAVTSAGRVQTTLASHSAMVRGLNSVAGTGSTAVTGTISGDAALKTYITDIQVANTGASTTLITFQDGSGGTSLAYTIAPAAGGSNIHFSVPLVTTANTALYFACGTSSTTVYVSAQGYRAP